MACPSSAGPSTAPCSPTGGWAGAGGCPTDLPCSLPAGLQPSAPARPRPRRLLVFSVAALCRGMGLYWGAVKPINKQGHLLGHIKARLRAASRRAEVARCRRALAPLHAAAAAASPWLQTSPTVLLLICSAALPLHSAPRCRTLAWTPRAQRRGCTPPRRRRCAAAALPCSNRAFRPPAACRFGTPVFHFSPPCAPSLPSQSTTTAPRMWSPCCASRPRPRAARAPGAPAMQSTMRCSAAGPTCCPCSPATRGRLTARERCLPASSLTFSSRSSSEWGRKGPSARCSRGSRVAASHRCCLLTVCHLASHTYLRCQLPQLPRGPPVGQLQQQLLLRQPAPRRRAAPHARAPGGKRCGGAERGGRSGPHATRAPPLHTCAHISVLTLLTLQRL